MESITIIGKAIIFIASVITACGVICGFLFKILKKLLNKTLDEKLKPFKDNMDRYENARIEQHEETKQKIAKLQEELDKNSLNTMKNTICNENIPTSERLLVGKEYLDKGGNGAVKVLLHKLAEEYEAELKEKDRL